MRKDYSYDCMIAVLEAHYEAAGFEDVYEIELKFLDKEEVKDVFYKEFPNGISEEDEYIFS